MNYLNQFYLLIYLNCTFSIYFSLQCGVPFTEQFAQMSHISVNQFSASVLSIICTPIASVYYNSTTRACWKYISEFSDKKKDPGPFHESWINQNLPGSIITISNVNYDGVMRDERLCDITWKSYWIYTTTSTYYLTEKKWYYIYFSNQTNGNFENNFLVILKKDNHNSMMLHMKNMAWCIHFFHYRQL